MRLAIEEARAAVRRVPAEPGSREPSPSVSAASGFDPSRVRVVTFEVDPVLLFDTLHKMRGDFGPLGDRVVGALMCDPGIFDRVGMAAYGVTIRDSDGSGEADETGTGSAVGDSAGRQASPNTQVSETPSDTLGEKA